MYDSGAVGGKIKRTTNDHFQCDFTSTERITNITAHHGDNWKNITVIFGLEIVSDKRSCGLMGLTATTKTHVSGHQLMFISGKFGSTNLKELTFYFDYGCQ